MKRRVALLAIYVVLLGTFRLGRAAEPAPGTAHVTFVSGISVYIDAGSDDGLAVGDTVELVRNDAAVGTLRVSYVTSHKAACSHDGTVPEIKTGDALRFTPHPKVSTDEAAQVAAKDKPRSRSKESAFRQAGMRGRIGVRYLWVKNRSEIGGSFSQPSLDLFLAGKQIGGAPVDLNIDARARRTYLSPTSGTSSDYGVDHIYQANVAWGAGPFRLGFGRQVSSTLAVVSLFDGLVAEYQQNSWSAGLLAGTQPDPVTYSFSSDVRQYGAYGGYSSDPAKTTRWHLGLGAISSTENGEINRDFVYLEARVTHRVVGFYVQQQVDINRGWRKDAAGTSVTPSATFAMLHFRPAAAWSVDGGYDSRRNVLLYLNLVTPVTTFDAATRQGYWLGGSWRPRGRWLVGIDGRRSTGGTAGTATSYTLRLGALNMTADRIDVQLRGTSYTGPSLDGYLAALSGAINLGPRLRLDLHGGLRHDNYLLTAADAVKINWLGTTLDVIIGRSMYFNLSYDRTSGGEQDNDQGYAAFSWRF